ncbi:MAG: hypothetical protein AAB222_06955, partial [Candidatus Binatota bacterium]
NFAINSPICFGTSAMKSKFNRGGTLQARGIFPARRETRKRRDRKLPCNFGRMDKKTDRE